MAFSSFFELMLPHCRAFIAVCPGTRAEDPEKVLQAFVDHFLTPSKDNPIPNFRRYGHKGRAQPYAIWFLKCFCNFLKENYKASSSVTANNVIPFIPVAPPIAPIPSSTVSENYPGVPGPTFPPLKAEDLVKTETRAPAPPRKPSSLNPFKDSPSFPTIEIKLPASDEAGG